MEGSWFEYYNKYINGQSKPGQVKIDLLYSYDHYYHMRTHPETYIYLRRYLPLPLPLFLHTNINLQEYIFGILFCFSNDS